MLRKSLYLGREQQLRKLEKKLKRKQSRRLTKKLMIARALNDFQIIQQNVSRELLLYLQLTVISKLLICVFLHLATSQFCV